MTVAEPAAAGRLIVVDALRGVAIVLMVVYHFCFDLSYFGCPRHCTEADRVPRGPVRREPLPRASRPPKARRGTTRSWTNGPSHRSSPRRRKSRTLSCRRSPRRTSSNRQARFHPRAGRRPGKLNRSIRRHTSCRPAGSSPGLRRAKRARPRRTPRPRPASRVEPCSPRHRPARTRVRHLELPHRRRPPPPAARTTPSTAASNQPPLQTARPNNVSSG